MAKGEGKRLQHRVVIDVMDDRDPTIHGDEFRETDYPPVFPLPPTSKTHPDIAAYSLDELQAARLAYAVTEKGRTDTIDFGAVPKPKRKSYDELLSRRAVAWVREHPTRALRAMERSVRERDAAAAAQEDCAVAEAMRMLPVPREGRDWPSLEDTAALAAEDDRAPVPVRSLTPVRLRKPEP